MEGVLHIEQDPPSKEVKPQYDSKIQTCQNQCQSTLQAEHPHSSTQVMAMKVANGASVCQGIEVPLPNTTKTVTHTNPQEHQNFQIAEGTLRGLPA
jgi:quercetin dioxygenase-like cupin family protein